MRRSAQTKTNFTAGNCVWSCTICSFVSPVPHRSHNVSAGMCESPAATSSTLVKRLPLQIDLGGLRRQLLAKQIKRKRKRNQRISPLERVPWSQRRSSVRRGCSSSGSSAAQAHPAAPLHRLSSPLQDQPPLRPCSPCTPNRSIVRRNEMLG